MEVESAEDEAPEAVPLGLGIVSAAEPTSDLSPSEKSVAPTPSLAASTSGPPTAEASQKVPVTIVTGFLGAGKTTVRIVPSISLPCWS